LVTLEASPAAGVPRLSSFGGLCEHRRLPPRKVILLPNRWFLLLLIAAVLAAGVMAARGPRRADGPLSPDHGPGSVLPNRPGGTPAAGQFRFEDLTGRLALDFKLADLHGVPHTLREHRGHVVMLIFWATWCKTCPLELPHLSAIARALASRGLVTLSINWEKDPGPVATMARGLDFPVLRDLDEHTRHDYDAFSVPRVVIVDRSGTIARVIRGYQGETSPIVHALADQGLVVPPSPAMERPVPVERIPLPAPR
jgi:thiol-disulfide isomerase/thioredoxin